MTKGKNLSAALCPTFVIPEEFERCVDGLIDLLYIGEVGCDPQLMKLAEWLELDLGENF